MHIGAAVCAFLGAFLGWLLVILEHLYVSALKMIEFAEVGAMPTVQGGIPGGGLGLLTGKRVKRMRGPKTEPSPDVEANELREVRQQWLDLRDQ